MEASTAVLPIPARPPRATAEAFADAVERLLGTRAHELFAQVLDQFTERLVAEVRASLSRAGAAAPADDLADLRPASWTFSSSWRRASATRTSPRACT
jgi:hypothetical protein